MSEEFPELVLCPPFCATMFQNVGLKVMDARANQKDVWLKSTNCSSATVILGVEEKRENACKRFAGQEARVRSCALCARSDPELSLKDKIQLFHSVE